MRALRPAVVALLLAWAGHPASARAHSVFSVGGLGEPQLEEPARLRALGGAGVAERGPRAFSMVNPASLADADHLLIEGTVLSALRRIDAAGYPSETGTEATIPSLRAVVALPGRIVLGGAYLAATNAQFRVDRQDTSGPFSQIRVEGSGGINFARVSLSRRLTPSIALGVDCDFVLGGYREEWARTPVDSTLATARDTVELEYRRRARWRVGALATRGGFSLGAVFETERGLPLRVAQSTAGASSSRDLGDLTLPAGFVIGASAPVTARDRVVAQYRRASWSRSSLASDLVDFRALERWSLGFERRTPEEEGGGGLGRLPIRVGGYYLRWPDRLPSAGAADLSGGIAEVNEWALTLGTGIRSKDKGGAVDLSLEAGSRGSVADLGARERFVRLGISLQVSDDTWKGRFH